MRRFESFGQTPEVEITVLVDNRADFMVKSTDAVKPFTDKPLLAEHGFAALVRLTSLPGSCFHLPFEVESAQEKAPEGVPDPQQEIACRLPTCGRGEKDVQSRDCYR
jgi:hypothetical protein